MVKKATSLNSQIPKQEKIDENPENNDSSSLEIENRNRIKKKVTSKRKIGKRKTSKSKKQNKKSKDRNNTSHINSVSEEIRSDGELSQTICYCSKHKDLKIEFICVNPKCLKELCSYCILEHKEHIKYIKAIQNVVQDIYDHFQDFSVGNVQEQILEHQSKSLNSLENISEKLNKILFTKIN